ncbi:unnamed protein product, partial [marine sediment metagenome]
NQIVFFDKPNYIFNFFFFATGIPISRKKVE